MRPECRDSDGRGVNREKEGRTRNTEWENNKGLGKRQNAESATRMHTEATCVLPSAIHENGGGIPTQELKATFQGDGCDITRESCSLPVLLQLLQLVLGHTQSFI